VSKPKALAEGFDVILATSERILVYQHRPDAEGLISILKCLKAKSYVLSLPFHSFEKNRFMSKKPNQNASSCINSYIRV
jgi:hypothetical protein